MSHKTHSNGSEESYSAIVPAKRSNESQGGPQEIVEGRALTKENAAQPNSNRTPGRVNGPSGLDRVRQTARGNQQIKFTALLHHINIDLLRSGYNQQRPLGIAALEDKIVQAAAVQVLNQIWGRDLTGQSLLICLMGRVYGFW